MPRLVVIIFLLCAGMAVAQDRSFRLSLDGEVEASGLADYLLPRFALKTGRRADLAGDAPDAVIAAEGEVPVMARGGTVYFLTLTGDNPAAQLFADWITSAPGQAAIAAFQPRDGPPFTAADTAEPEVEITFDGDARLGEDLAEEHCARCHRVGQERGAMSLGSTPSFPALRALADWDAKFQAFYALNPHPSFLRVTGISPPFDPDRPPVIAPVELSPDEVEAIQAYAAGLDPADLGAPVQSQ